LQRAWRRHGLPAHPPQQPPHLAAAERLSAKALRRLGWSAPRRRGPLSRDPQFAADAFQLARRLGIPEAARQLGVAESTLHRVWERNGLDRPEPPPSWPRRFLSDRALVERAFRLARERSILAAASAFQTSAPTLYRAWARHGLGHPHAGIDQRELWRRWTTQPGPDHRYRAQHRDYRARRAAERRADRQPSTRDRDRRSRPHRPEERER
jgi:hypothetical protein